MSRHQIDYESLQQDAMRGLVRNVMLRIAKTGLPGDHHFYISFHTRGTGVTVSKRLLERYPDEMTIVLQNKFSDLKAYDDWFEVTLWFDSIAERLTIPYSAIKVFFDPSVPFGHQFEVTEPHGASASQGPTLIDRDASSERPSEARPAPVTSVTSSPNSRSRQAGAGAREGARTEAARPGSKPPVAVATPGAGPTLVGSKTAARARPETAKPSASGASPSARPPADKAGGKPVEKPANGAEPSPAKGAPPAPAAKPDVDESVPASKVIALDAFRKKS